MCQKENCARRSNVSGGSSFQKKNVSGGKMCLKKIKVPKFRRRNVSRGEMSLDEIKFPKKKCVRRRKVSGDKVFG